MVNVTGFDGRLLGQKAYGTAENFYLANNIKQSRLGVILQEEYAALYNQNYLSGGPQNNYQLYHLPFSLKNNLGGKIIVLKSFVLHQQFDNAIYNQKLKPIDSAQNTLWSPISINPDQDVKLERSFNISYIEPLCSALFIETATDRYNKGSVIVGGIHHAPDFTANQSYLDSSSWSIEYDPANAVYRLANTGDAGASLYLPNQFPNSVTLKGKSTWSSYRQVFTIAVIGNDIITSAHSESPFPGDDNNPSPMKLVIPTGWSQDRN